jgi:two-component system, chemotaxis family, protein-glutamate methylesterase/glutaminase
VAYGRQVIGVVLTGNLDDGSAGLACIKSRGGLAIVQDPDEAMAPSMPTSAIESVQVDFILPAEEIGPKLVELAPTQVEEKVQAIEGGNGNIHSTGQSYPCPECGGVLNEVEEGEMVRFRCRVGHLYSPESLLADQSESVERALWAAIRSMEEQAEFSDRMAANSRQKQRPALARRFSGKAEGSRANATVLRDLLQKAAEDILEVPEERTGTD